MIRRQNDILEICLERLAQGETVEAILADYASQADELRPLLQAAQQLHSLPSQQLSTAADRRIEQRLRRVVRQQEPQMVSARQRPFSMEDVMKSVMRLLPRVALGVVALGLIVFAIAQLPFWGAPEMEPIVSSTAVAVTGSEPNDVEPLDLSADPGEVYLYRVVAQPVPDTPEAMLAWAAEFGLPDAKVYERPFMDDPSKYVLGSDGRRLGFNQAAGGEIYYSNPSVPSSGDTLPFDQASQIAVAFLSEHGLLPATYRVDAALFELLGNGWQSVAVRATVDEGIIGEMNGYGASLTVHVASDGQIAFASLRQLGIEITPATAEIISAQEAYEKLLAGQVTGHSRGEIRVVGQMGNTFTRPTNWAVGQTLDMTGYVELLLGVEDVDDIYATLSMPNGTSLRLVGPHLAELAAEMRPQSYRVQGVLTAQLSPSMWELEVQEWQVAAFDGEGCLVGELLSAGDEAVFRSDIGDAYPLPQAPLEISAGERLQVCLLSPAQANAALDWAVIQAPPPTEQVFSSGDGSSNMVVQEVVVAQVEEIPVTRVVVSEEDEVGGETAVQPAIPLPPGSVAVAVDEAPFTPPESPYQLGDSVEIIGYVQGMRLVNDANDIDSSRLELQLVNDAAQSVVDYPLTYSLLASKEVMEAMAAFADLHIRVVGEIVAAPESSMYVPSHGQAIMVESFDRPWPDESLENFLGHFAVEEIEGEPRMIFTDHATEQRYVVDPQYSVVVHEGDMRWSEEQLLLTAIVHPFAEPIGGLPVLLSRGQSSGPDIAAATDISQVPLPPQERIGVINEAFTRGNEIGENDIIERVELVYPYNPYDNQSVMTAPPIEPVWLFYGRNTAGTISFTMTVRAVK